jgi:hypothetical protein
MTTTCFKTTIKALTVGAKSLTVEKAVSNLEGWGECLSRNTPESRP